MNKNRRIKKEGTPTIVTVTKKFHGHNIWKICGTTTSKTLYLFAETTWMTNGQGKLEIREEKTLVREVGSSCKFWKVGGISYCWGTL